MRKFPLFFIFFMLILLFLMSSLQAIYGLPEAVEPYYDYEKVLPEIDPSAIIGHIAYLSSLGSRVTGYPGSYEASEYIAEKFREYGLKPLNESYFHEYRITVPLEREASLTLLPDGPVFEVHALWPNGVQTCRTPPGGVEGFLLYVGEGTLRELSEAVQSSGIDLEDFIALMEFNSMQDWVTMDNWVRAASFGIKAIVFIAPKDTNRVEAQSKFLRTPINIPRLYVSEKDGLYLKALAGGSAVRVRVELDMRYEDVMARNVIGIIEGSQFPEEVVLFSAYYDSWSIVPSLAPGADEASGVATLLELAKFFASHRPRRTLWFVAFSGHWQAMAGAREFVEKFYFSEDVLSGRTKLYLLMNLYLSTESPTLTYLMYGQGYGYTATAHIRPLVAFLENARKPLEKLGFAWTDYVETWWPMGLYMDPYGGYAFVHEAEVVAVARSAGLSWITTRSARLSWGSPFDRVEKVRLQNLKPQVTVIFSQAYTLANVDTLPLNWDLICPKRYFVEPALGISGGYAILDGEVTRYDPQTQWYTFQGLENYDILVKISYITPPMSPGTDYIMTYIIKVPPNGTFTVHGVGADAAFGKAWIRTPTHNIEVYCINKTTGIIEWFSDSSKYGWPSIFGLDRDRKLVRTAVFKCASATLYGISGGSINEFQTHAAPVPFWGRISIPGDNVMMVFLPDGMVFEVISGSTILLNASETHPEGVGFTIDSRKDLRINVPIQAARDMYFLNKERYDIVKAYDVTTPLGERSIMRSGVYLEMLEEALERKDYEEAYGTALAALWWHSIGYWEMRNLINDMTYASMTFGMLLIPFMFLGERLFLPSLGRKRIASLGVVFLIPYLTFYIAHPGSLIAIAAPLAIESYAILFFTGIVFLTVSGNLGGLMREVREKAVGLHFAEISRSGAFLSAVSAGIEEMRKRRLRSFLTMVSIILMTFSLVSLASSYGVVSPVSQQQPSLPYEPYHGMLIQRLAGFEPISYEMMAIARWGIIGREIPAVYRAWVYPSWSPDWTVVRYTFIVETPKGSYNIWAALGLQPEEAQFNPKVTEGLEGRWFDESDIMVCIVSKKLSEKMGIEVGGKVVYSGVELTVVGIMDDETFSKVVDLDAKGLAPIDTYSITVLARSLKVSLEELKMLATEGIPADRLLIIPFKLARKIFNAPVYSIAVKNEDLKKASEAAEELVMMTTLPMTVYVSGDGKLYIHSRMIWYSLVGFQHMAVLYIIVMLSVLTAMLNSVYEKTGEIKVFSAVGLAPLHVVSIFVIQSALYGIIGSVIGYLGGLIGLRVLIVLRFFPPEFIPNFAASAAFFPIGLTVVATVVSALYPALKASSLVTPSLERKWKLTTKPVGDEWSIEIPFRMTEEEVPGIIEFMREYMESQAAETMGPFITLTAPVSLKDEGFMAMNVRVHLAPFDANVTQDVSLIAKQLPNVKPPVYDFHLHLKLLSGNRDTWMRSNLSFIDKVRKQILIWRGLREVDRARYLQRAKGSL